MKCPNCGFEYPNEFNFCQNCGAPATTVQPTPPAQPAPPPVTPPVYHNAPTPNYNAPNYNGAPGYQPPQPLSPAAQKIVTAAKEPLVLTLCILMTVATAFSLFSGNLPVVEILITIFLWIARSKALKGVADYSSLRVVSGSVYANYVITNVVAIILMVCGVIFAVAFSFAGELSDYSEAFMEGFEEGLYESVPQYSEIIESLSGDLLTVFGWIIGLFFIIFGVVMLLINLLGYRKIHRFAQSVYQSINDPNVKYAETNSIKGWLIFFAVCTCISAASSLSTNFMAAVASGCSAAVMFIAVSLITKHFIAPPQQPAAPIQQPQYPNM